MRRTIIVLAGIAALLAGCTAKPQYAATKLKWEEDIKPIIMNNCYVCHGGERAVDDKDFSNPLVVVGNQWDIYKMVIVNRKMPAKNTLGISLSESDRRSIGEWIRGNMPGAGTGAPY